MSYFELSGKSHFQDFRHLMSPKGIYIPAEPQKELLAFLGNVFRNQKVGYLFVDRGDTSLLSELAEQLSNGRLEAGRYREFPLSDFQTAFDSLKQPGRIGRIVLRLH